MIVSGVGRSGTSMIAKLLETLGIPMGETDNLPVHEDRDFNNALYHLDHTRVRMLIDLKNTSHQRWGFKFASLQNHIFPPQFGYFRNPHLIIVMRDAIATAARSYISDEQRKGFEETLINVGKQTINMIDFICNATCPTLVISYEKFIGMPDAGIDAIANFCGIVITDDIRREALATIEPNNLEYINLFHPKYRGNFDSVKHGHVVGWCAAEGSADPVDVELVVDGKVLAVTRADIFRADLLAAEIGAGEHGFRFDISDLNLRDEMVLQVRAAGSTYVVNRSGRRFRDFPDRHALEQHPLP